MNEVLPAADKLAAATAMGAVTLLVGDLDEMTRYYRDVVTLQVLDAAADTVTLGRAGRPIVILRHEPALRHATPGSAGLFHTAILFETQAALAAALYSVARTAPGTFTGSADHLVSQAFYFTDPEGNGVELYVDRPRAEWVWKDGAVQMGNAALDPNTFIEQHLERETAGIPDMGHVHLKVGDLTAAREFYEGVLGFAVTAEADGAIFLSAGGYHHHLAANTWGSAGAAARPTTLGLGSVGVVVPAASDLDALVDRLESAAVAYERTDAALSVADPWGTTLEFSLED
ncbi:MAG: VOC family protein [Microbacterium sp.]